MGAMTIWDHDQEMGMGMGMGWDGVGWGVGVMRGCEKRSGWELGPITDGEG
jgi:hypothetical protein